MVSDKAARIPGLVVAAHHLGRRHAQPQGLISAVHVVNRILIISPSGQSPYPAAISPLAGWRTWVRGLSWMGAIRHPVGFVQVARGTAPSWGGAMGRRRSQPEARAPRPRRWPPPRVGSNRGPLLACSGTSLGPVDSGGEMPLFFSTIFHRSDITSFLSGLPPMCLNPT